MSEVTLREFFQKQICELDKRIDQRFIALDKALALQAEKDQKHFNDLNHEQARLQVDRERYLPRETYAADRASKTDTVALWVSIVALAVAVINLFPWRQLS